MANLVQITNYKSEFSENILPTTALISDTTTLNYTGDLATLSDNYSFEGGKSIRCSKTMTISDYGSVFDLGSALTTNITKDGFYLFSFRVLDNTSYFTSFPIDIRLRVYINSVLSYTLSNIFENGTSENKQWYGFAQNLELLNGDVVDFSFEIDAPYPGTPNPTLDLYIGGFKLELNDRFLTIPSIYSKPKDYNELTTNIIFVNSLSDLPTASAGVITLDSNKTYYITTNIDLLGNRLVGSENTTIIGASSEVSVLTSTGLGSGIALLTSIYTTPIRHIAINDVDTAVNFDGTSNPSDMALDWTGVNFVNVPNVGVIKKASNFIFDKGAFLNSKGLVFDGTIGTVALNNSLFSGDGLAGNILQLLSTCTITRRFRVIYSSIVATSSNVGINVNASASIPVESYILDTVNFSGGATYLSGVSVTDNKTLFANCKGIANTNEVSQYYMNGNATTTTVSATNTAYKVLGTTTSASITQKFTNTSNRATYVGSLTRFFKVTATLSLESANNNQIGCYIAKNGIVLGESEVYGTTSGVGRAENIVIQTLVELSTNDYIEIFVENATAISNILVTELNVIVQ